VVCACVAHTTQHVAIKSKTKAAKVNYYNLDAIISIGYRVNPQTVNDMETQLVQKLHKFAKKLSGAF